MYRVTVLYGVPKDRRAFDTYYRSSHIPLAREMKGLTGWNLTWVAEQNGDVSPPVHLIADLYATDQEAMARILASPAGQAARADLANFVTGGATFLFGVEEQVEIR